MRSLPAPTRPVLVALALATALPAPAQECFDYAESGFRDLGTVGKLPSWRLAAAGDILCTAGAETDVEIIDVSRHGMPRVVGSISTAAEVPGIAMEGRLLAFAERSRGLVLYDLADPAQPVRLTEANDREYGETAVGLGHVLSQADGNMLVIHRIGDDNRLETVSETSFDGPLLRLLVDGSTAYCLFEQKESGQAELSIIDWSRPESPRSVGTLSLALDAHDLAVSDGRAFVVGRVGFHFLVSIDVSDPARPREIGRAPVGHAVREVAANDQVIVVRGMDSLEVFTEVAGSALDKIARIPHAWDVTSTGRMVAHGGALYLGNDEASGVRVRDLGNAKTVEVTWLPVSAPPGANAVLLDGLVATIDMQLGFKVFDLETWTVVLEIPFITDYHSIAGSGRRVVITGHRTGPAYVFDLTEPSRLSYAVIDAGNAGEIHFGAISGDRLALLVDGEQVVFYDLSGFPDYGIAGMIDLGTKLKQAIWSGDRLLISSVTGFPGVSLVAPDGPYGGHYLHDWLPILEPGCTSLATLGDHLYTTSLDGYVHIVDMSDTDLMVHRGRFRLDNGNASRDVAAAAGTLYVRDHLGLIHVYDLKDREHPEFLGNAWVPSDFGRISTDGTLFLGHGERELFLMPMQCTRSPVPDPVPAEDIAVCPNPFNPRTSLSFTLARGGPVSATVYDLAGRRVRTLAEGMVLEAGLRRLEWDGRDERGRQAASGIYLARVRTQQRTMSAKMMLIR